MWKSQRSRIENLEALANQDNPPVMILTFVNAPEIQAHYRRPVLKLGQPFREMFIEFVGPDPDSQD